MVCDGIRGEWPPVPLDAPPHASFRYEGRYIYLGVAAEGPYIMRFYSLAT